MTAGIGGIAERYAKNTRSHPSGTILSAKIQFSKTIENILALAFFKIFEHVSLSLTFVGDASLNPPPSPLEI